MTLRGTGCCTAILILRSNVAVSSKTVLGSAAISGHTTLTSGRLLIVNSSCGLPLVSGPQGLRRHLWNLTQVP
jgi:hypothetical protein